MLLNNRYRAIQTLGSGGFGDTFLAEDTQMPSLRRCVIKPDNIIIRYKDGKPVLIDFGAVRETMATEVNSQGNPTTSIVIGTPGYMPSEQAMGRAVYASDLYSLGLTAIYLLTGKLPQTLETDSQTGEINWERNTVNPNFATVLDKAIAYHPQLRFRSTKEMLEALQETSTPMIQILNSLPPPATSGQKTSVTLLPSHQSLEKKGILFSGSIAGALTSVFLLTLILVTQHSHSITSTKVSQSVQLPIATTGEDYLWLEKRAVTEADLEGKDGLQLDIMRNSIFARHGRRFNIPELQKYFDRKLWYHPLQHLPSEFDKLNLLSKLEQKNAAYIDAYQDQHNKRYFPK